MPRLHSQQLVLQSGLLRHYLAHGGPVDGPGLCRDAFHHGEMGAVQLIKLALDVRVNARTKRTLEEFAAEHFNGRRARGGTISTAGASLRCGGCCANWPSRMVRGRGRRWSDPDA